MGDCSFIERWWVLKWSERVGTRVEVSPGGKEGNRGESQRKVGWPVQVAPLLTVLLGEGAKINGKDGLHALTSPTLPLRVHGTFFTP